jgi:myo-inositol 2-dehydrogenase / D-chiro-inositol 1-dehydrogenase
MIGAATAAPAMELPMSKSLPDRTPRFSRRGFLKSTTAALALPLVAGSPLAAHVVRAGGDDRLRVGLIGCGGRGTGAALQALRADKGAVLVAMGDLYKERIDGSLELLREELGDAAKDKIRVTPESAFVGFDAYQRVIACADVVLLTALPAFRPEHIEAAVAAGKHVFCEKPMAVDAPGLRRVRAAAEAAKAKGLAVVSGFCWRYHDGMRAVFEKIGDGALGDVVTVHTTYHGTTLSPRPRQPAWSALDFQIRNWWHFAWLSGDHIVEQACHSVDRLSWAMGDVVPARASALGGRQARQGPESGNVYDHFAVTYEWDDGRRAFHSCRQQDGTPADNSDYVYGTKGFAAINGWAPPFETKDRAGKRTWSYDGPLRDMYQNEHDALFAAIRSGRPINDGEQMCRSTALSLMGRMAAYTGQTITWEQVWASKQDLRPANVEAGEVPIAAVPIPGRTPFV